VELRAREVYCKLNYKADTRWKCNVLIGIRDGHKLMVSLLRSDASISSAKSSNVMPSGC
jgi:hypothetical protein